MAARPDAGTSVVTVPALRAPVTQSARAWMLGGVAVVAAIVALAGASFACSPSCCFATLVQDAGPSQSRVTVQGTMYGTSPVEIRWGSTTGALLATPTGSSWSQVVTIPNADPGYYSVVVIGIDPVSHTQVLSSPTFHVTGASTTEPATGGTSDSPSAATPSPSPSSSGDAPAASTSEPQSSAPAGSNVAAASSVPAGSNVGASSSTPAAATSSAVGTQTPATRPAVASSAPAATGPTSAGRTAPAAPASKSAPVAAAQTGPAAAGAAVPAPAAAMEAPLAAPAAVPTAAEPLPLPWSSGSHSVSRGLLDAPSGRHQEPLGLGLALLGAGLVAAFGAVSVIGMRRAARAGSKSGS